MEPSRKVLAVSNWRWKRPSGIVYQITVHRVRAWGVTGVNSRRKASERFHAWERYQGPLVRVVSCAAAAMVERQRIVRRKLSDEVLDRLLPAIEGGEYPAGSQLPSERDLMTEYGVGRPAVREALQALDKLGLIAITHGERARVVQPTATDVISQIDRSARHLLATSPQSLDHLKDAREFFEVGMASEAARKATPEDLGRLEAALELQKSRLRADSKSFVAADMAFHTALAAVTRNPVFEAVSRAMLQWLSLFHSDLLQRKGRDVTLAEHDQILQAVAARDPEAAADAMRSHLRRARALYAALSHGTAGKAHRKTADQNTAAATRAAPRTAITGRRRSGA